MYLWVCQHESCGNEAEEKKSKGNQKIVEKRNEHVFPMCTAGGFVQRKYYSDTIFYLKLVFDYSCLLYSILPFLNNLLLRDCGGAKQDSSVLYACVKDGG